MFETQNLIIREVNILDASDINEMLNDEEILKYNCLEKTTLKKVEESILNNKMSGFFLELKKTKKIIGHISIDNDDLRYRVNSKTISYYLNSNYTKQGYMTEALKVILEYCFNELKLDVVSARSFSPNLNSQRLLLKNGFTLEGILRKAVIGYNDIIYDDCLFSITHNEYIK